MKWRSTLWLSHLSHVASILVSIYSLPEPYCE